MAGFGPGVTSLLFQLLDIVNVKDKLSGPSDTMASVILKNTILGVESTIGCKFKDSSIVWEAMQAAGSGVFLIGDRRIPDGNKRLAVVGDTILKLALVEEWYNGGEPRGNETRSGQRGRGNH